MANPRTAFRCLIGGDEVTLSGFDPHLTLLDFLRLERNLKGTKEGCAEGDCGACTVLVGRIRGDALRYDPVNACIVPLGSVDSTQVLTVEHLADPKPHPVQHEMARCHGSQCGFCTPGIVMSLAGLHEACTSGDAVADLATINDTLAGNLCRCTGYGPIIEATQSACRQPRPASLDLLRSLAEKKIHEWDDGTYLKTEGVAGSFCAPNNLESLWAAQESIGDMQLLAGATDVGLWVNKQHRRFSNVVDLGQIEELRIIKASDERLTIGAGVTLAEALVPLGSLSKDLDILLRRFGSTQVRAKATVGGNIANGSPIGDLAPALIALGACVTLASARGSRTLALEDFFIDYGKQDRAPDEIVLSIEIPLPAVSDLHCWKISKRFDQDISAVCGAFALTVEGGTILSARVAFGGMAATPRRAFKCEQALIGAPANIETLAAAKAALHSDFEPISDMRASAAYRKEVAGGLLEKCLRLVGGESIASLYPQDA